MSSSVHVDNKGKYNLILGSGSTQGLGEHSLTAEKIYWINFTLTKKKRFASACITMERIVIYLLMV